MFLLLLREKMRRATRKLSDSALGALGALIIKPEGKMASDGKKLKIKMKVDPGGFSGIWHGVSKGIEDGHRPLTLWVGLS
jgi:hypothetical protein